MEKDFAKTLIESTIVNNVRKTKRNDKIDCKNGIKSDTTDAKSKAILGKVLSNTTLSNIPKNFDIISENEPSEAEGTDDEGEEYIEYVFNPRQYYLQSVCQLCKDSISQDLVRCIKCNMVSYCSKRHMALDAMNHRDLCIALNKIAAQKDGHLYNNIQGISHQDYQALRVSTINTSESMLNRPLEPFEREILLFPRICNNSDCREWRSDKLEDCKFCKQITFCKKHATIQSKAHKQWCKQLKLFEKIIVHQTKFGKIRPILPKNVCTFSTNVSTISQVFGQFYTKLSDIGSIVHYTELTQIASPALTTWFALKLTNLLQSQELIVHIIGAEQHFEIDTLNKWELFLMHLIPELRRLHIVFVGPELNIPDTHIALLQKERLCKVCRHHNKEINYSFINSLYHDYVSSSAFSHPSIVCYFNPGLYRSTGFNVSDTWPATIRATVLANCPVLVTSYTSYESSLDLKTYLKGSDRLTEIILPSIVNPFRSQRPERNFVSEDQAPLIFKSYYMFVVR